ncbi:hypothetical protein DSL92_05440 [Billgrantia gudaonensis]|uniref:Lon protease AAA domain-containing protein n=1 Tax=Billgrantia gudaonensis TaxID=376427 RepID=A0A3S0QFW3_9GAMM|nr:hypothetical protein DSL92_05440 [Halomonas gudaonensis]
MSTAQPPAPGGAHRASRAQRHLAHRLLVDSRRRPASCQWRLPGARCPHPTPQPGAWETLKRVLRAGEIRTESLEQAYGLISTTTLEPEPVPLDLKIVLLGERLLYLLCEHDPDFLELFKVQADLEDDLPWSDETFHCSHACCHPGPRSRPASAGPQRRRGDDQRASRLAGDQHQAHRPPPGHERPVTRGRPLGRGGPMPR